MYNVTDAAWCWSSAARRVSMATRQQYGTRSPTPQPPQSLHLRLCNCNHCITNSLTPPPCTHMHMCRCTHTHICTYVLTSRLMGLMSYIDTDLLLFFFLVYRNKLSGVLNSPFLTFKQERLSLFFYLHTVHDGGTPCSHSPLMSSVSKVHLIGSCVVCENTIRLLLSCSESTVVYFSYDTEVLVPTDFLVEHY